MGPPSLQQLLVAGGVSSTAATSAAGGVSPWPIEVQALTAQVVTGVHVLRKKVGYLHLDIKVAKVLWSKDFRHVALETFTGHPWREQAKGGPNLYVMVSISSRIFGV